MKVQMVDLVGQYHNIQKEIEQATQNVMHRGTFINGPEVKEFASALAEYLNVPHVIPCGNGTDALQIALMALGLKPGDEVIVPAFTYAAAIEVVLLLGMTPVVVDVDPDSFNIDVSKIEEAISPQTKAIIAVHLFGQCCDMAPLLDITSRYGLYVIEDNAQATGATYTFPDGSQKAAGTIGHIGTTSFFPTKPLACYGDGGAMITSDEALAERARMISQHGQTRKYHHAMIGCNSRLDTLQAAVLLVKLKHLETYRNTCQATAMEYNKGLAEVDWLQTPTMAPYSTHVWHQYTLRVKEGQRDSLKQWLAEDDIPSMVYYPLSIDHQQAFQPLIRMRREPEVAHQLCNEVLSIPVHTELTSNELSRIIERIKSYETR